MSEQLRRIQFVTTYYSWLQGLRFVPIGLVALALAAWLSVADPAQGDPKAQRLVARLVLLGGMALAGVLYAVLGAYYRRRFGVVQASAFTRQRMIRALGISSGIGLLLGGAMYLSRRAPIASETTVFLTLLASGLGIVWYWHWSGRVAHHYLPVAAAMAALGLLELLGASPVCALLQRLPFTTDARCAAVTLSSAWGVATLVVGVLDHRLLVRTLGHAPEPETEEVPE